MNAQYLNFKAILSMLLIGMSLLAQAQQHGSISGTITTADGQPAEFVNVIIVGTNKATNTDTNGKFEIKRVTPGSYTLQVSFIGFDPKEQSVEVTAGQSTTAQFVLNETSQELDAIEVHGERINKFTRNESDYVSKMPLKNLENPQVYTTISKELLADQLAFSVDDAMKNAPGLTKMWDATGRSGDGGSYYNLRGFIVQSQLRNGIAGNVSSKIDAVNLEKIEVIKGPSATLFGNALTSYGGLINRVTKKPYLGTGGEVTYATGSFGFNRVSADFNTPLDEEKNVVLRINTAYNYNGSFQDNGFAKTFAFAPSLSYKVDEKLSFNFDAEFLTGQNTGLSVYFFPWGQTIASMGVDRADELSVDYKRSYVNEDLYQTSRNINFFGQMNYKISDAWQSQTNFTSTSSYSDGPSPYFYLLSNASVTGNPNDIGADYISRNDQFTENSTDRVFEFQQNFIGEFTIGNMRNRFVGGLDFFYKNSDQFFSGGTLDTVNVTEPIPNYRNFNRTSMDAIYINGGASFVYPSIFKTYTYSAYVSDVLNITDKLIVLAALRIDHFDNNGTFDETTGSIFEGTAYSQTALAPKFGVVFQPVKDKVSLFANYQNGFTNKSGTSRSGKSFKPEQANQLEGGIKLDAMGGKLSGTISYYDIQVQDLVRSDVQNPGFSIQDGTQVSKGIEAEIVASPIQGLNIIAGFAYNDSEMKKSEEDVAGLRPSTASSPYAANFWASYSFQTGAIKGLGFGFGGNYASDNKVINSKSIGVFTLPAYTVLNASLYYDHSKYRVGLKVDNLTDEHYWIGYSTVNPQKLRSVTGSITYRF
jgi:iron complex outermembrane receptor protein